MKKRDFLKVIFGAACAVIFSSCTSIPEVPNRRPNIIFVFNDDHTRQAIGAYNGAFAYLDPTPNIDRLASSGMRFDRCYVGNSICAPSRATVLTGKHSHANGKSDNRFSNPFDHSQQTFPQLLQKAGYATALIGKTHLMHGWNGFDYLDYFPGGGDYYQPTFFKSASDKTRVEGYVTDLIMDRALAWMDSQSDSEKPFMLCIWNKAPHREFMPPIRHADKWHDHELPLPDNFYDDYAGRPAAAMQQIDIKKHMGIRYDMKVRKEELEDLGDGVWPGKSGWYTRMTPQQQQQWDAVRGPMNRKFIDKKLKGNELLEWKYQRYAKDYLRTSYAIDENVDRLLTYLQDKGLSDDTVIVYSSDQGFFIGEHGWYDKRFMYEESYSTPLIVRWPGVTRPGSSNSDLVQNIDFAPTFLDIAGVPVPDDMQGVSLKPLLKGKTPSGWRKSLYYHYTETPVCGVRAHEGVSTDRYKLIRFYGKEFEGGQFWEFYDLKKDPSEMNNSIDDPKYSGKIEDLKAELKRLRADYNVPDGWPSQ